METVVTRRPWVWSVLFVLVLASPLSGATYAPIRDAALLEQATHVAELAFYGSVPASVGGTPAVEHLAIVSRPLKGEFESSTVRVVLPGGDGEGGLALEVPGIPRLRAGADGIVFLVENRDGSFGVLHWALGYFERADLGRDGVFAVRDLREFEPLNEREPDTASVRDYEAFAKWIEDRAGGVERGADYLREAPAALGARFNLFVIAGKNLRWTEFDDGESVGYRVRGANSFGSTGQIPGAMAAWNRDSRTNVDLRVAGGTSNTGGLSRIDGVNGIIFGDPNRALPGSYSCTAGGIVAAGGFWFNRRSTHMYRSREYITIVEGDIVINDGVNCLLAGQSRRSAEVFTHELGHTLGIRHSCGDTVTGPCTNAQEADATMRAGGQFDNRGASIRSDDAAALRQLYESTGGGGGGGTPPPTAGSPNAQLEQPTNLVGTAASGKKIDLAWEDNSTGEGAYEVLIKVPKEEWTTLVTLPADSTSLVVKDLSKGTNYRFKVRSLAGDRRSPFSEIAVVRTLGRAAPEDPTNLRASEVTASQVTLVWSDNSDNEKSFVVWQRIGAGDWQVRLKTRADVAEVTLDVSPSTEYTFRIRAKNGNKLSGFSNEVTVTTPAS